MKIIEEWKSRLGSMLQWLSAVALEEGQGETLAALRILLGFLACYRVLLFAIDFPVMFSTTGWLNSNCDNLTYVYLFSLLNGAQNEVMLGAFLVVAFCAAASMTVGFFSRLSSLVVSVCLISLNNRFNVCTEGSLKILALLILFLSLAESGGCWSIDNLIRIRMGRPAPTSVSLWPQKLIQTQIAAVYGGAFFFKILDPCWVHGVALYYDLQSHFFTNFWVPEFVRCPPVTNIFAYATLAVEAGLGFLPFFKKTRTPILLAGALLHLGIAYLMFIPLFGPTMIVSYVAFYKGEEVALAVRRLREMAGRIFPLGV